MMIKGSSQLIKKLKIGDASSTISLENFAPLSYSLCVLSGSSIRPVL